MTVVSVIRCDSYDSKELKKALEKALSLIDFKFKYDQKILIKPNLLGPYSPDLGITTHPLFIEALIKILKKYGSKIYIGESSSSSTIESFEHTGILALKKKYDITLIDFEDQETFSVDIGSVVKKVHLPKIINEMDLIINLPKLKTHGLTGMTLAIKNLYGFIPGTKKSYYHRIFPDPIDFSRFLVELNDIIKPELTIVDGIIGLEGNGPGTTGTTIKSNIILASTSTIALDLVGAMIIGFDDNIVTTNRLTRPYFKEKLIIKGDKISIKFKKPYINLYKPFIKPILYLLPRPKISFNHDLCIKCSRCKNICPTKVVELKPFPICDHKNCIKCFCCIEVCPKKAVYIKESAFFILLRNFNIFLKKVIER